MSDEYSRCCCCSTKGRPHYAAMKELDATPELLPCERCQCLACRCCYTTKFLCEPCAILGSLSEDNRQCLLKNYYGELCNNDGAFSYSERQTAPRSELVQLLQYIVEVLNNAKPELSLDCLEKIQLCVSLFGALHPSLRIDIHFIPLLNDLPETDASNELKSLLFLAQEAVAVNGATSSDSQKYFPSSEQRTLVQWLTSFLWNNTSSGSSSSFLNYLLEYSKVLPAPQGSTAARGRVGNNDNDSATPFLLHPMAATVQAAVIEYLTKKRCVLLQTFTSKVQDIRNNTGTSVNAVTDVFSSANGDYGRKEYDDIISNWNSLLEALDSAKKRLMTIQESQVKWILSNGPVEAYPLTAVQDPWKVDIAKLCKDIDNAAVFSELIIKQAKAYKDMISRSEHSFVSDPRVATPSTATASLMSYIPVINYPSVLVESLLQKNVFVAWYKGEELRCLKKKFASLRNKDEIESLAVKYNNLVQAREMLMGGEKNYVRFAKDAINDFLSSTTSKQPWFSCFATPVSYRVNNSDEALLRDIDLCISNIKSSEPNLEDFLTLKNMEKMEEKRKCTHDKMKRVGGFLPTLLTHSGRKQIALSACFMTIKGLMETMKNAGGKIAVCEIVDNKGKRYRFRAFLFRSKEAKELIGALLELGFIGANGPEKRMIDCTCYTVAENGGWLVAPSWIVEVVGVINTVRFNALDNNDAGKNNEQYIKLLSEKPIIPPASVKENATVILLSGSAGVFESHKYEIMALMARGVNVLGLNFRGYGSSMPEDAPPSEDAVKDDAEAAYQYIRKVHGIPNDHIIVKSLCLGGAAGAYLAGAHNGVHLLLDQGYSDLGRVVEHQVTRLMQDPTYYWWSKYVRYCGIGWAVSQVVRRHGPQWNIQNDLRNVRGNVGFIMTSDDITMRFEEEGKDNVNELVKSMEKLNLEEQQKRCRVYIVPGKHADNWTQIKYTPIRELTIGRDMIINESIIEKIPHIDEIRKLVSRSKNAKAVQEYKNKALSELSIILSELVQKEHGIVIDEIILRLFNDCKLLLHRGFFDGAMCPKDMDSVKHFMASHERLKGTPPITSDDAADAATDDDARQAYENARECYNQWLGCNRNVWWIGMACVDDYLRTLDYYRPLPWWNE